MTKRLLVIATLLVLAAGCGMLTDKDRIKIAKLRDQFITRGDLFRIIRETPDDERPHIQNKGDLLRVLQVHIDERIKQELGKQLQAESKITVNRDTAKEQYFQLHKDENYREIYTLEDPSAVGMTKVDLDIVKEEIETGIDRLMEKMLGDAAVMYRAKEAAQSGAIQITDEDVQKEYNLRKDSLVKFEWMRFKAVRFPLDIPNAETEAANVRRRLDAGETFDAIYKEFQDKNPQTVVESEIENNPGLQKFTGFWNNASGANQGDILGPVFLPAYQMMGRDPNGKTIVYEMPDAYLVLRVEEHKSETTMSLDEAKMSIALPIIITKTMDLLRKENAVEIYEDKIPEPEPYNDLSGGDPIRGTS